MAITVDKMALLVPMDQGTMEGVCIYGDYEIVFNPTGLMLDNGGPGYYDVWISDRPSTDIYDYPDRLTLWAPSGSITDLTAGIPNTKYAVNMNDDSFFYITCISSPTGTAYEGTSLVYTINGIKPGTSGYDTTDVKDVYFIVQDNRAEQIIESRHIACIGGYRGV